MKRSALLLGVLISATTFASQGSFTFQRSYKEGDVDKYKLGLNANTPQGALNLSVTWSQKVVKVYPNGDADIESTTEDAHGDLNGEDLPVPIASKPVVSKFSSTGARISGGSPGGLMSDMMSVGYSGIGLDKPLTLGQEYPIDQTDPKNPRNHVKGTVKLSSIIGGIATVLSHMQIDNEQLGAQNMTFDVTAQFDAATSKPKHITGKAINLPANKMIQIDSATFTMDRLGG